ncbi:MAG: AAA family ATPase [Desulfatibacillaceae bacterium]
MLIELPDPCLVVLCGASGSGKSSFASKHFSATEIVSSDACRAMVCDDPEDQSVNEEAFALAHTICRLRLELGRLAVMDATSVEARARRELVDLAEREGAPAVCVVLALPLDICLARQKLRPGRTVPADVVRRQAEDLWSSLKEIGEEGFSRVYLLQSAEELGQVRVARTGSPVPE